MMLKAPITVQRPVNHTLYFTWLMCLFRIYYLVWLNSESLYMQLSTVKEVNTALQIPAS